MCIRKQTISVRIIHIQSNHQKEMLWIFIPINTILPGTKMLTCQGNAVAIDSLWNTSYVSYNILQWLFNSIPSDVTEPEVEPALMLLTPDILSYNLPGLNIKNQDKPWSRRILDKDTSQICDELEQTLTYMLQKWWYWVLQKWRGVSINERTFLTYIMETKDWQKLDLLILCFVSIPLCLCHKGIIYAKQIYGSTISIFKVAIWSN